MSVQEMLNWFDILQDKYASPYFTDDEKLLFLNRAQFGYISQFFPENDDRVNFEMDSNTLQKIAPLIYESDPFTMSSSGVVSKSNILSDLQSKSADASCEIYKVISIEYSKAGRRFPCKVMRHNDKAIFEDNYFKRPKQTAPKCLFQNGNIQFRPLDTYASIYITTLKTPRLLALSPDVNSELPSDTHNEIVARALEFAGFASREEIMTEILKRSKS